MERWAIATGNASNPSIWNGGTLPLPADDVYAGGFDVTVDISVAWDAVRTAVGVSAPGGGQFILNDGVTLTAKVQAGLTQCVIYAGSMFANIVGNVTGGSVANATGVLNNGDGVLTIYGDVTAGSVGPCRGAQNAANGIIRIMGSAFGTVTTAVSNALGGNVIVAKDAVGGTSNGAYGLFNQSSSTGLCIVHGYAIGSDSGVGAGVGGQGIIPVQVYRARIGANGCYPIAGKAIFPNPGATTFEVRDVALASKILKLASSDIKGFPLSRVVQ